MAPSFEYLAENEEAAISKLMADVDQYRGFPGFYWQVTSFQYFDGLPMHQFLLQLHPPPHLTH